MKMLCVIAAAAAVMAGLAGCATTGAGEKVSGAAKKAVEASGDATVLGDWELQLVMKGKTKQAATPATMTVSDAGGNKYTFSGFSGVNTFSGSLTIGLNGAIAVDQNIVTTRVGGTADMMSAERAFLDALKGATSWKAIRVGVETLEMYGQTTLCFTRLTIKDRVWNLTAQSNDKGTAIVSLPEGGRKATLMINNNKANVYTGLNITNADCTLDEAARTLSFSLANAAMTLASGSAADMETERLYLKNLAAVASYSVSGRELSLLNAKGNAVLVFTAQDLL